MIIISRDTTRIVSHGGTAPVMPRAIDRHQQRFVCDGIEIAAELVCSENFLASQPSSASDRPATKKPMKASIQRPPVMTLG